MTKNTQRVFAAGLIIFGALLILSNFMNISMGNVIWALIIIGIGVLLITNPDVFRGEGIFYKFIGDFTLDESWTVEDYNLRAFITEVDLDLEFADFPEGETMMNFSSFISDITVGKPEDVALKIKTNSFLTDSKVRGAKGEVFFTGLDYKDEGYDEAAKKLNLQVNAFVTEIND